MLAELRSLVETHGHIVALLVFLSDLDDIAVDIHIQMHTRHAIRRKEAVFDTLLERISVYRFVEIIEVIRILFAFRRSGQTDLRGTIEILQHFAPSGILLSASSMTLIYDDQVKEIGVKLQIRLLSVIFVRDELLIKRHVQLIGRIEFFSLDLGHDLLEGLEILRHRLVDEDIAVGKVEDMVGEMRFAQTPYDLECCEGLTCTGSHDEQ